ncbi:hypothetical protein BCR37DRAFT_253779 [Protomyces lactucae-debilis]|uniref:Uncharacterized protein n=1 Tax=Protomyces lactucae-debilis TaxID=2754530 RepID=A0A1Y2FLL7_PROLT|nr:uncharacterized protein BCR37DRAFT_253779 [Protomyces lactucae-debilis]ORY84882.1 hypothetical protein BCR37DRAFT_253779 [Protomyces lactucae-debilis]
MPPSIKKIGAALAPGEEQCPLCKAVTRSDQGLQKHLKLTCWRHYKSPIWVAALKTTYAAESADYRVKVAQQAIAKRFQAQDAFLAAQGVEGIAAMTARNLSSMTEGMTLAAQAAIRKRKAKEMEAEASFTLEQETDPALALELQIASCIFCKRVFSTKNIYRNHLHYEEAKHFKSRIFIEEMAKMYMPGFAILRLPTNLEKIWIKQKEQALADKQKASESASPVVATAPWMNMLDCVLSQSIVAWYVWYLVSEVPRSIRSTCKLNNKPPPFANMLVKIEEAIQNTSEAGCIPGEDLKLMRDLWKSDPRFKSAFKRMSAALKLQMAGASDALKECIQKDIKVYRGVLLAWLRGLQASWQHFASMVTTHVEHQSWYKDRAVTTPQRVAELRKHWAFWQPLFLDMDLTMDREEERFKRAKALEVTYRSKRSTS